MMFDIKQIFATIDAIMGSDQVLLAVFGALSLIKGFFLYSLLKTKARAHAVRTSICFLIIVLIANVTADLAWVVKMINNLFIPTMDPRFYRPIINIAWALNPVQYQFLSLFIESLSTRTFRFTIRHLITMCVTSGLALFSAGVSIISLWSPDFSKTAFVYLVSRHYGPLILLFPIMIPSICIAISRIRSEQTPRILAKQMSLILWGVIIPFWLSDVLQVIPFHTISAEWVANNFTIVSISGVLLTFVTYYCTRRIMGLRFLNMGDHVTAKNTFQFTQEFTTILEQLSHVTNLRELGHVSQRFFKEAFHIPFLKTRLYLRSTVTPHADLEVACEETESLVESFVESRASLERTLCQRKILIYNEIVFNEFYRPTEEGSHLIHFLDALNADVFLPIGERDQMGAYLIVERGARYKDHLYSNVERDEMIIFASYMAKVINLMQHRNLNTLIMNEKDLKEELYRKHQEINQYKESIRSFLRPSTHKQIGIIFYKNRRFTFGNQAAKELVPLNPNVQEGHPLSRALKKAAMAAETYKTHQTVYAHDTNGERLVIAAVPSLEHNNVFITLSHPDISDVVKKQLDTLQDPSEWDYLLYLETTKSGQLINQLIPGSGEILLRFKIDLLKCALSKKALLLDVPEADVHPTAELLHHVSLRETLHILTLKGPEDDQVVGIKLFGINPIFGITQTEKPLMQRLDKVGTLLIENVHFLSSDTQEHLAELIRYGLYRPLKSNAREASAARIICSTTQNLHTMTQEGTFSSALLDELRHTTLCMPSLSTLPEEELRALAQGFGEQAIQHDEFKNLLSLSDREKNRLIQIRPTSLRELKKRVQQILLNKSSEDPIHQETQLDSTYNVNDPTIVEAARLGRRALRDPQIMGQLWGTLKSQSKIATLLGVNRSSVNRRCKDYGFIETTDT